MVFGERAQADFEERLKNKKMKVYEVDETENRYEVKPLKPISTKTRWREILRPSVQVVGRGKRKSVLWRKRTPGEEKIRHDDDDDNEEEYTSTGEKERRRRVHVADKSGRFRGKDLPEKYRKQYLIQVEMQKKKKKKKNMNRTGREEEEHEEEEAALTVERRSAPNVYRSDTIATKPYQTATNVHNLNPFMVKEKDYARLGHAIERKS